MKTGSQFIPSDSPHLLQIACARLVRQRELGWPLLRINRADRARFSLLTSLGVEDGLAFSRDYTRNQLLGEESPALLQWRRELAEREFQMALQDWNAGIRPMRDRSFGGRVAKLMALRFGSKPKADPDRYRRYVFSVAHRRFVFEYRFLAAGAIEWLVGVEGRLQPISVASICGASSIICMETEEDFESLDGLLNLWLEEARSLFEELIATCDAETAG